MKKVFYFLMLAIMLNHFSSCNKSNDIVTLPNDNIVKNSASRELGLQDENGVLLFPDEETFEKCILKLDSIDCNAWELENEFISARKIYLTNNPEADSLPLDDKSLMTVLNANYMVGVGNWRFKLNPISKKVFVLPADKLEKFDLLLAEEENDSDIQVYSFSDDVWGQLSGSAKCNEECINADKEKVKEKGYCESNGRKFKSKCKLKYNNFGITKKIKISFSHRCMMNCSSVVSGGGNAADFTQFSIGYHGSYQKKCAGNGNPDKPICFLNIQKTVLCYNDRDYDENIYHGTKCLSDLSLYGYFFWVNMCTTSTDFETETLYISK